MNLTAESTVLSRSPSTWFRAFTDWMERPAILARATAAVWVLAIGFRLVLALLNLEANDNHMAVSQVIAFENRIPPAGELHQAYHPVLFHGTVAMIWRILPDQSLETATRAAQLLNGLAGIFTLIVVFRFLKDMEWSPWARFACFGLLALNPRLVSINVQASNDSFVILFGTLILYFGYRFFQDWRWVSFFWMWVSAVLAMLSKANGVILFLAVLAAFGLALLRAPRLAPVPRGTVLLFATVFVAGYLAIVPWLGPYGENVRAHGTPFISNHDAAPFPDWTRQTSYGRPGATSIVGAVFTFRFLNLIQEPMNTQDKHIYPVHRTSLWSQLYGRYHFAQFENHPASWRTRNPAILWLGRAILVLALLPTTLFLLGLGRGVLRTVQAALGRPVGERTAGESLLVFAGAGVLVAIALFSLRQRIFAAMNAIYIFPAILAMTVFFIREYDRLEAWLRIRDRLRFLTRAAIVLLLVLYSADLAALVYQLR